MTDRDRAQPLIDPPAVARRLEVNDRHVRRLVSERRIPFVKWGHLLRFDPLAIEAARGAPTGSPPARMTPGLIQEPGVPSASRRRSVQIAPSAARRLDTGASP
jgi:excisionase family DNA binding protein